MLTTLRIENFAIVKLLELDFKSGMTAFTGETGAGKSIMIDALMLALGERADASVIRPKENKCDITATFFIDIPSPPAEWLEAHEVDLNGGDIILRRVIYSEGRSKSFINGQPFSLQKIKEFSEMLVHIHGQHQHQTLLQHTTHRQQLDSFANHESLLEPIAQHYKTLQNIKSTLRALSEQEGQQDRLALLEFQLTELSQLAIGTDEITLLNQEHQQLHHANDYLATTQNVLQLLKEDESFNIATAIHQCMNYISELPSHHASINTARELLSTALIHIDEAVNDLQSFTDGVQLNPERLQQVESRLSLIHATARKYHCDPSQLLDKQVLLQAEYDSITHAQTQIQVLEKKYQQAFDNYQQVCLTLTHSRQMAALRLEEKISHGIQQLGMPNGYIKVEITPLETLQPHGKDKVEYKVCTNPGMPPETLGKIASGGELSRISLAIQIITAERASTPTLLFDEVDVGIGGTTATLVGQMLQQLGQRLQVFCVTHQPQVAACAHHQFRVEKQTDTTATFSNVIALDNVLRISEIARMLGGHSTQSLSHAAELFKMNQGSLPETT